MHIFVVTRFSLRIPEYEGRVGLSDENRVNWFRYRAKIFNGATLKCVLSQTSPVSRLYLLMDPGDKDLYEQYIEKNNIIEPIYTFSGSEKSKIAEGISRITSGPVLIARLDSDDLISTRYFEELIHCSKQDATVSRVLADGKVIIKATNGFVSDLNYIEPYYYSTPPFLCVFYVEFAGEIDLGGDHREINSHNPIECRSALWLMLAHGSNVYNAFTGRRIFRVAPESWPVSIPMPNKSILDRTLFDRRGSTRGPMRDKIRLWVMSQPAGASAVRFFSYAKNSLRRIQRSS